MSRKDDKKGKVETLKFYGQKRIRSCLLFRGGAETAQPRSFP